MTFPQLRRDPVTGRPALIAPERGLRRGAILPPAAIPENGQCPFCEGNEAATPPEVHAIRRVGTGPNLPGWQCRVFPNLFPAVRAELGQHELIVESPTHLGSWTDLSVDQIARVLDVVGDRLRDGAHSGKWSSVQWFKNHGAAAGASLSHAHSQLLFLPAPPELLAAKVAVIAAATRRSGDCPYCQLIANERQEESRVVVDGPDYLITTAFAARFPYEMTVLPIRHQAHFETEKRHMALATILRQTLERL